MTHDGDDRPDDAPALAEVTGLWRGLRALRRRPDDEQARLLGRLGLTAEEQRGIRSLLDRLDDIRVVEPGVLVDDDGCPLGWQPSVLAPVFHGFSDLGPADGLPCRVRVFFPSIDGSPQHAAVLSGCGDYPLVVFLHGQCREADHYQAWDLLPAVLARSGYVVAVPELPSTPPFGGSSNADIALVEQVLAWMRASWAHAAALMPRPMTAVVGHSWGALLGAFVVTRLQAQGAVSAYASLSGGWLEWPPNPPRPLPALNVAAMFMWGTGSSDLYAQLDGANGALWEEPRGATHKVVFRGGEHWDYLREGRTTCGHWRGPCSLVKSLAADFLATFLSHYVPPQRWTALSGTVPHSLLPPPLDLTPQQETFAGGHLSGLSNVRATPGCSVTHTWRLPPFGGGSVTLSGP